VEERASAQECPSGGVVVVVERAGEEIDRRPVCRPAPRCPEVYGDVVLRDPLRVLAFASAGCVLLHGRLAVESVTGLRALPPFAALRFTAAGLRISGNRDLRSLESLRSLGGSLGSLEITDNATLTSLVGLENVDEVRGPFRVTGNRSLLRCEAERLRDLIGLSRIAGPITIEGLDGECPH
jgi:hypothetical protein